MEPTIKKLYSGIYSLLIGTTFSKVIGVASIPIITRLYSVEDLGVLATYTAIVLILSSFSSLRYSAAIPLPRKEKTAFIIAINCMSILVSISLILWVILFFFNVTILVYFGVERLTSYYFLIPIGVFIYGLFEISSNIVIRSREFSFLSKVQIYQSITGAIIKVLFSFKSFIFIPLIIGQVVSQGVGSFYILNRYFKKSKFKTKKSYHIKLLKVFSDYPIYRLPSQVLLVLCTNFPVIFFSMNYGLFESGQLGLALMTIGLPVMLIGNTISKVYYGEIAKLGRNKAHEIKLISLKLFKKLLLVSIPVFVLIFSSSVIVFSIAFGDKWIKAGEYTSILSIYLVFNIICTPFVGVLNVIKGNIIFLVINFIRVILVFISFLFSFLYHTGPETTLLIYSLAMAIHYIITLLIIYFRLDNFIKENNYG